VASINFVTSHDGFTLHDLVSFNEKNNDANGENSQDGESHNRSWNSGAEWETVDPEVPSTRRRPQRNFLSTILLSQDVPMLLHGDELGRTQHGKNTTYAEDSTLSWVDWSNIDEELLDFTSRLVALRQKHPLFRGAAILADDFVLYFNASDGPVQFVLPSRDHSPTRGLEIDTTDDTRTADTYSAGNRIEIAARSTVVFRAARG
jgi:pullulanase/glycogen debranching enzyme